MPEQHLRRRGQSMAYKLNVTEHANELLDNVVYDVVDQRQGYLNIIRGL